MPVSSTSIYDFLCQFEAVGGLNAWLVGESNDLQSPAPAKLQEKIND
jgi:hypothetical protein